MCCSFYEGYNIQFSKWLGPNFLPGGPKTYGQRGVDVTKAGRIHTVSATTTIFCPSLSRWAQVFPVWESRALQSFSFCLGPGYMETLDHIQEMREIQGKGPLSCF